MSKTAKKLTVKPLPLFLIMHFCKTAFFLSLSTTSRLSFLTTVFTRDDDKDEKIFAKKLMRTKIFIVDTKFLAKSIISTTRNLTFVVLNTQEIMFLQYVSPI